MADPIKITVRGSSTDGIDAPTVDDLLLQIQDFAAILKGVETAMSDDARQNIVWRVTDVTKNSPLSFELTPFPVDSAMNIDNRAIDVISATSNGIKQISSGADRPAYFTDKVISRTEKLFKRVTNGLTETTIDLTQYKEAPSIEITRQKAPKIVKNILAIQSPKAIPYTELGSVEGTITRIERDGFGRAIVWLRARIDGQNVKCIAGGNAANRMGHVEIERVWEGLRVRITGKIRYKALGVFDEIVAENVQFFAQDKDLPEINDILDAGFGQGVESVKYLRQVRQDA